MKLRVFSAGAVQCLVEAVADPFKAETGCEVDPTFATVGLLTEKLNAGERCDIVVLTALLIADLERKGQVVAGASAPLGRVRTGIAVRKGDPRPAIGDAIQLRASLVAATGIYVPDTLRATAGVHFSNVLRRLGIDDVVAPRMHLYPNGATAMRALAATTSPGNIGCTQITEILATSGTTLIGPLPPGYELATVYVVGVCIGAPPQARRLAAMLGGGEAQDLRARCGFE